MLYTKNMKKVLLVEDDMFISDMIEDKLSQSNFTVETTADGDSVLQALEDKKPDILLLDLMLPNKHGFVVLEEIRQLEKYNNLPVIILSNENGTDVEERAKLLNASYYFKAMTDMNELVAIVNETLA